MSNLRIYSVAKLLFSVVLCSSMSLAHTQVTRIIPVMGATVKAPNAVNIELDEAINLRFSNFWVYALPKGQSAADFAAAVLPTKGCDSSRADTCPKLMGLAARLSIPLKPHLNSGTYVVVWRILSDDGHVVMGNSEFTISKS